MCLLCDIPITAFAPSMVSVLAGCVTVTVTPLVVVGTRDSVCSIESDAANKQQQHASPQQYTGRCTSQPFHTFGL